MEAVAHRVRLVSFNVNGLRPMLKRRRGPLTQVLQDLQADIVCFQETKLSKKDMEEVKDFAMAEGWNSFFSFCTYRSGYAGVATFCKEQTAQPLAAEEGMSGTLPMQNSHASASAAQQRIHYSPFDTFWERYKREDLEAIDNQGRCMITDHGAFVLFAVYLPAVTDVDNERFPFKMRCLEVLQHRMESCLAAGRSVVLAGDLNVAPFAIDHCDYVKAPARIQAEMLDRRPDRAWFRNLLQADGGPLVDLHRRFHPHRKGDYSVWNMKTLARARNHGSRVDFVLAGSLDAGEAGKPFVEMFSAAGILDDFEGSDHAPVYADLQLPEPLPKGSSPPALDLRNRRTATGDRQGQLTSWLTSPKGGRKRKAAEEPEPDTPPRPS